MKLVPATLSRKVARQALLAEKNSPTILFGAGVVGMVSSTVLACRATLKLEGVLDEIENEKSKSKRAKAYVEGEENTNPDLTYTDDEMRKDLTIITIRGVGKVAALYLPSVVVGGLSIFALTKSHNILQDRNHQLTAAYFAVNEAFARYRARVVEKYGPDEDRILRYDGETVDIIDDETGKVVSTVRASEELDGSMYARWFDETSVNWSRQPEYNILFLRQQQNYWNDVLHARGHVFLNEVYKELGLSHTKAGAVVGWIRKGDGDGFIDFGCWDGSEQALDFFNGREGAILLDFNVDGPIWENIDESMEAQQWGSGGRA